MRGIAKKTAELIRYSCLLLKELHPMTLRQLHYAVFSRGEIHYQNNQPEYRRLSRVTTIARRRHREWELSGTDEPMPGLSIPSTWIVDETRRARSVSVWDNVSDYIETVKRAYRRDNWQGQDCYCEIWSEKETVLSSIQPTCQEWGVTMRPMRGFSSTGQEMDLGGLFEGIDKDIHVFFLGDHDPSGRCIETDIHRRVQDASGKQFTIKRLAIHPGDIKKYNLPPQMIKDTDTRATAFREKYGQNASTVELDALPVDVLRRRIAKAVEGLLDVSLWNHQLMIQDVEFKSIEQVVSQMRAL